jgi:hypothetical protein
MAFTQGLQIHICLTHLDEYRRNNRIRKDKELADLGTSAIFSQTCTNGETTNLQQVTNSLSDEDCGGRLGETIQVHLKGVYLQLSQR